MFYWTYSEAEKSNLVGIISANEFVLVEMAHKLENQFRVVTLVKVSRPLSTKTDWALFNVIKYVNSWKRSFLVYINPE